ncbi:hypothetical protein [Actinoplanes sichuanensis]|uniref:Uncharacterized protein n=1 Tax=Actinoplanes sichuanensis TaxID=512349 RepID=A0ABW4A2L5_9ACTN
MTVYGLREGAPGEIFAVWPAGDAHRVGLLCQLPAEVSLEKAAELAKELTDLSASLWELYAQPPLPPDESADHGGMEATLEEVGEAILIPHLPSIDGSLLMSYDEPVEFAHRVGRVLHAISDRALAEAVTVEVGREINAVRRAGRGDFEGRAAQGVVVEVIDPSPLQVAAADELFHARPLGDVRLWRDVTPAAACVAGVNWLVAAAGVAAEIAGLERAAVFAYADDIESTSVEVPTFVVRGVEAGLTPRQIVVEMLSEATGVREGLTPDPVGLTGLVDAARARVSELPAENREDMLVALLGRLTLLDPARPSRDLLEHILSGLSSCLLVYREHAEETAGDDLPDEDDASAFFLAAVSQRASASREQLLR